MEKITTTPTPIEMVKKINEVIDNSHVLQRNTAYAVGDIAYSPLLPSWARLECVKAGTTAVVQPEWTNVFGGGGVLLPDGGLVWLLEDIRDGLMVGGICLDYMLRDGRVKANGALLQRASYPRLFEWVERNKGTICTTEADWQKDFNRFQFTLGDGNTTFRVPDLRGKWLQAAESIGSLSAGLPNIAGKTFLYTAGGIHGNFYTASGAFMSVDGANRTRLGGTTAGEYQYGLGLDASRSNPIYGNSTTVQPPTIQLIAQIKY